MRRPDAPFSSFCSLFSILFLLNSSFSFQILSSGFAFSGAKVRLLNDKCSMPKDKFAVTPLVFVFLTLFHR